MRYTDMFVQAGCFAVQIMIRNIVTQDAKGQYDMGVGAGPLAVLPC